MDEAKNQISNLEYKKEKKHLIRTARRKNNLKNEDSIRSLWDNFKYTNICIMVMPEGKERERVRN